MAPKFAIDLRVDAGPGGDGRRLRYADLKVSDRDAWTERLSGSCSDVVERTEAYINSVRRIQQLQDIEVNIPNHPDSGEVFERYEMLTERQDGDPHPFVDPESWNAWLALLILNAEDKLEEERRAANAN